MCPPRQNHTDIAFAPNDDAEGEIRCSRCSGFHRLLARLPFFPHLSAVTNGRGTPIYGLDATLSALRSAARSFRTSSIERGAMYGDSRSGCSEGHRHRSALICAFTCIYGHGANEACQADGLTNSTCTQPYLHASRVLFSNCFLLFLFFKLR